MTTDALRAVPGAPAAATPVRGTATPVLATAVLLGVAGDFLLRAEAPGLGLGVWLATIVLALEMLARREGIDWTVEQRLLVVPVLFFGEAVAWREAELLTVLDLLSAAIALAVLSLSLAAAGSWSAVEGRLRDYIFACVNAAANAATGTVALALDAIGERRERPARRAATPAAAVARGLLLAAPLLLVFGLLLGSADPVFARIATDIVDIDFPTLISHLVLAGALAWVTGGWLRGTLLVRPSERWTAATSGVSLGIVEIATVLGAVNLLFLAFVLVQLRYLFGGAELVQATAGLSFAEYARRGFFELVFVALLVLPMLLTSHAVLRRDRPRDQRAWRVMATATLVLLAVIVGSALERMRLYVSAYALSEDRLYALAFMGWLVIVFALFAATVLRDRVRGFGIGALASGWAMLGALNLANPDALVARVNLSRGDADRRLDGAYLGRLSADALPVIMPRFATLPVHQRCAIAETVLRRHVDAPVGDWRSWNRSRARARAIAASHVGALRDTRQACMVAPPAPPRGAAPGPSPAQAAPDAGATAGAGASPRATRD
jgi:hypothetical protein